MADFPRYPQGPAPTAVQTSTLAIVSLVAGILGWTLVPTIGAIVAVITGHMAKNEIRRSGGLLTGEGLATAGLVLGYVHLALAVVGICLAILMLVGAISIPVCLLPFTNNFQ